jgi:hypothetical protein
MGCERREDDVRQEGEMLDFLQWSAALLALVALCLWFWSGAPSAEPAIRRKRQIGRVAIFAAVVAALLQAAGASASITQLEEVEVWASAAPTMELSAKLPV